MAVKKRRENELQLNLDIPRDLIVSLEEFCEEAKMSRKAVLELALRRWLNDRRVGM